MLPYAVTLMGLDKARSLPQAPAALQHASCWLGEPTRVSALPRCAPQVEAL